MNKELKMASMYNFTLNALLFVATLFFIAKLYYLIDNGGVEHLILPSWVDLGE